MCLIKAVGSRRSDYSLIVGFESNNYKKGFKGECYGSSHEGYRLLSSLKSFSSNALVVSP